jgi:hypothetical protein
VQQELFMLASFHSIYLHQTSKQCEDPSSLKQELSLEMHADVLSNPVHGVSLYEWKAEHGDTVRVHESDSSCSAFPARRNAATAGPSILLRSENSILHFVSWFQLSRSRSAEVLEEQFHPRWLVPVRGADPVGSSCSRQ